jgi:hypothetical protein
MHLVERKQGELRGNMESTNNDNIKIKSSEISPAWLEKYPIWIWCASDLGEDENYICPLATSISDDFSDIFVKASFLTPMDQRIEGYIICDIDTGEIYAISLFWKGEEYVFNKYVSERAEDECKRLSEASEKCLNPLFPLQYQCNAQFKNIFNIKGVFNPLP